MSVGHRRIEIQTINIAGNPAAGRVGGGVQEEEKEDAGQHVGRNNAKTMQPMLKTVPTERNLYQYCFLRTSTPKISAAARDAEQMLLEFSAETDAAGSERYW